MTSGKSVIMMGATGAVGTQVLRNLITMRQIERITLLNRRAMKAASNPKVTEHIVDVLDPKTYEQFVSGHEVAICTLGVGDPSTVSKERFVEIDRDGPLKFAVTCKGAGLKHYQLLSSVGVAIKSSNYFLRSKGELEDGLRTLNFDRLSLFHPSMILTPNNRYGIGQALTLMFWPKLNPFFQGPLRKIRGIPVEQLGRAIAYNSLSQGSRIEVLEWDDFQRLQSVR